MNSSLQGIQFGVLGGGLDNPSKLYHSLVSGDGPERHSYFTYFETKPLRRRA
ncbi:MAG: hypothetical protein KDA60_06015 [Planctomycetales bacterium]|nr:hypothetical protein [Planctomycetales bacterium]